MSGIAWFLLILVLGVVSLAFFADRNRKKWKMRPHEKIVRSSWESRSSASKYVITSIGDGVEISPEERKEMEQLDVEGILAYAVAKDWISSSDETSLKDQLLSPTIESSFDSSYVDASFHYKGGSESYEIGGSDGGGGGE
ncbi:hypothetical protein [Guptibacillus algicola]|uniref:hypothetical protein n=1 Tax=Guptibacillus algicola TaxID=225844 RepID=UPI001CD67E81|nr:hypothetical protein [Alkalihalobacillus algicola]MCA0988391.1 hypothetical protein [Alkalihalobacillus algicola]